MVSDVAELTRTLRKSTSTSQGQAFGAEVRSGLQSGMRSGLQSGLRARLREVSQQIKAELNSTGQSIFTDESGNRYLIQREPSTR